MKRDPFYVKDQLTEQIDHEEQMRNEKRKAFMLQQRKTYEEIMKKKEEVKTNRFYYAKQQNHSDIKITDIDKTYKLPNKIDNINENLYINLTKDNSYTRGYHEKNLNKTPQMISFNNSGNKDIQEQKIKENENQNALLQQKDNKEKIEVDKDEYGKYLQYLKLKDQYDKGKYTPKLQEEKLIAQPQPQSTKEEIPIQPQITASHYYQKKNYINQPIQQKNHPNYPVLPRGDLSSFMVEKQIPKEQLCQYANNTIPLPNPNEEAYREYISNKMKNISTYSNLTHLMTNNTSSKTLPKDYVPSDIERQCDRKLLNEKQREYKGYLDDQIRNRPQSGQKRIERSSKFQELPPNPCKKN